MESNSGIVPRNCAAEDTSILAIRADCPLVNHMMFVAIDHSVKMPKEIVCD